MNEFEEIYDAIMEEAREAREMYLEWLEMEIDFQYFFPKNEEHTIKTEIMPEITTKLENKFNEEGYEFEINFLPSITSIIIRLKIFEIKEEQRTMINDLYRRLGKYSKRKYWIPMLLSFVGVMAFIFLRNIVILATAILITAGINFIIFFFLEFKRREELKQVKEDLKQVFQHYNFKCFIKD